jgi:hypothetical protein
MIFLMIGTIFVIAVLSAIIAVAVVNDDKSIGSTPTMAPDNHYNPNNNDNDKNGEQNTLAPSEEMVHELIDGYFQYYAKYIINLNYTDQYLYQIYNDTNAPQYQARQWLLNNDTLLYDVALQGISRFIQRYG